MGTEVHDPERPIKHSLLTAQQPENSFTRHNPDHCQIRWTCYYAILKLYIISITYIWIKKMHFRECLV